MKLKLSASTKRPVHQVAAEVGLSKTEVLRRLHSEGIRRDTIKVMAGVPPRPASSAPFGKKIVGGKPVNCRRELKVARVIVELRRRQGLVWREVAERLNRGGYRTRTGRPWQVMPNGQIDF